MRDFSVSLSTDAIANVRKVLQTVDQELFDFEGPHPTDASQQTPDDILSIYETLLAHGFDADVIEKALQVSVDSLRLP